MSVAITTIPTGTRLSAGMTCPRCEAPMVTVSTTKPTTREWKAVMRCGRCNAEQLLLVRLLEVAEPYNGGSGSQPATCGTTGGYNVHRKRQEPPCDPCKAAHAASERSYNQRRNRVA